MTATISGIRTRILRAPLPRPWGHDVTAVHIIVVDVECSDGTTGHGFTWTPSIGARAVRDLIEDDLAPFALGRPADPGAIWEDLWRHAHELGGGGATTVALAGIDLALWDAKGRRTGSTLPDLLGRRREHVPTYASGVNLHYSLDELVAQTQRWVEAGFDAVKIKVGRPKLAEDVERVSAVRQTLGPERALRVDANQRWDLATATTAIDALSEFDLDWVEEPLRADDLEGHRLLRQRVAPPIAVGENLHTRYRVQDFLRAEACDVVQPNVVRVGGITPFLDISGIVADRGVRLAPHLLPDLSGQLALALAVEVGVEDVESADFGSLGVLVSPPPLEFARGFLRSSADAEPGLGLRFSADDAFAFPTYS